MSPFSRAAIAWVVSVSAFVPTLLLIISIASTMVGCSLDAFQRFAAALISRSQRLGTVRVSVAAHSSNSSNISGVTGK